MSAPSTMCHRCWLQLGMYSRTTPFVKHGISHLVVTERLREAVRDGLDAMAICGQPILQKMAGVAHES